MTNTKPRNPRIPEPTLAISDCGHFYAWKIDHHGILTYSNAKRDAKQEWLDAYNFEYFYEKAQ